MFRLPPTVHGALGGNVAQRSLFCVQDAFFCHQLGPGFWGHAHHCLPFSLSLSSVGQQVNDVIVTAHNWTTGGVPTLTVSFKPSTPSIGGTVIVAVHSTSPQPDLTVFAKVTPADPSLVMVGLPGCTGAIGTIYATNRSLVIALPNSCVLAANTTVTVQVPSSFFGEMPPAGTTVVLSVATSTDPVPRVAPGYTVGVHCRIWHISLAQ